jgi:xanthine dehydrogenase YagR molybdenum-binding subunit
MERKDKVTGRANIQRTIPSLGYTFLVQSEIPHGAVSSDSLEKRSAEVTAAPRVLDVLTPLNYPSSQVLRFSLAI